MTAPRAHVPTLTLLGKIVTLAAAVAGFAACRAAGRALDCDGPIASTTLGAVGVLIARLLGTLAPRWLHSE